MADRHWTTADIPDQTGRVAVVTGSNTGLGLETARALAGAGAEVVLAIRNLHKGETARSQILESHPDATVQLQSLDLGSLDSVRTAADELLERHDRLDLLINNAGVMYTEWQTTSDGFEFQMGVNHLGHFVLTDLLIDRLMTTDGSRVVNVSSVAHKIKLDARPGHDDVRREVRPGRRLRPLEAGQPAVHLRTATPAGSRRVDNDLARRASRRVGDRTRPRRLLSIVQFSMKFGRPILQSAAKGALPQLRAATDPDAVGGEYYGPDGFMEGAATRSS